jgi:deoxycytidylate deaminase
MKTTYIPWGFDVLHSDHRKFIDDAIRKTNPQQLVIGIAKSSWLAQKKWSKRPFFSDDWRIQDMAAFLDPLSSKISKQIVLTDGNHDFIKQFDNVNVYTINSERAKREFPGFKVISAIEWDKYHTTDIYSSLINVQNLSWCYVRKVGSVLVRDGSIVLATANDIFQESNCNTCPKYYAWISGWKECGKELPCKYLSEHAEQLALEQSIPWDDLFSTHAPCLSCAKSIIEKRIRRIVYISEYTNPDGVNLLQKSWIGVRKAWI